MAPVRIKASTGQLPERLRDLWLDRHSAGLYVRSPEGQLLGCNGALAVMLGYSSVEELVREAPLALWSEEPLPPEGTQGSETTTGRIRRLKHRSGRDVLVVECTSVGEDGNGSAVVAGTVIEIATDRVSGRGAERAEDEGTAGGTAEVLRREIAEHRRTQEQLDRERRFGRSLVASSLDMIMAADHEGRITEYNPAASLRFGYEREEVIGKDTRMLYADPEDYRRVQHELDTHGAFAGEVRNIAKDGSTFISFLAASRLYDEGGRLIGAMGVSRDITRMKEDQERLRDREARLRAIFEGSAGTMIWTLDKDLRITSCNARFRSAIEETHGIRISVGDAFVEAMRGRLARGEQNTLLQRYRRALEGEPQHFEVELIDLLGNPAWVENYLSPIVVDGEVREISCLAHGITDRKQAQAELLRNLHEKEVLLKEVHHRVKNNLQIISSIFNLQAAHAGDDPRIQSLLRDSRDRIHSMAFIHESLYQSKDLSSIDLAAYIEGLGRNMVHSFGLGGRVRLHTELVPVELVLDQAIPCGLILNELVSNALKHAFPGGRTGTVRIVLEERNGLVHLLVADDGVGVQEPFDDRRDGQLGFELIHALTGQLGGSIARIPGNGVAYLLTFERTKQHRPWPRPMCS
jgi:PAS domain S-box-containing protein